MVTCRNINRFGHIHGLVCTHIFSCSISWEDWGHVVPRLWFLISFFIKWNQGSLEKIVILGPGQNIYKMSLDHFVVPEDKEMLKAKAYSEVKGTQEPDEWDLIGHCWNNMGNEINNVGLYYNPKYRINIHESKPK